MVPWKRWEDPYKDDLFIVGSFIFFLRQAVWILWAQSSCRSGTCFPHLQHKLSHLLLFILYPHIYTVYVKLCIYIFLSAHCISFSLPYFLLMHAHTHTDTHVAKYTICSHTHTAGFTGRFASSHLINLSLWGGYGAALGLAHLTCSDTPSFSISLTPHNADLLLSGKRVIGLGRLGLKFWPPSNNHHLPGVWSLEEILWNIVWWLSAL